MPRQLSFRIYLRYPDQRVSDKTVTPDPAAALSAFTTLVSRADLDGQDVLAVLNFDGEPRQIAQHHFGRQDPGKLWRGRTHEIVFPVISKPDCSIHAAARIPSR